MLWTATATASAAQVTVKALVTFDETNGANPFDALVQGIDGNIYGTTEDGGAHDYCGPYNDCGTVFKVTPAGKLTTLFNFCRQKGCADGNYPYAGLVQSADGNFYGTTVAGGAYNAGTIFKITPHGMLITLHTFDGSDGSGPYAGLVRATNGNFYGTAEFGGAHKWGTVFKITAAGQFTTLHRFCSQTNCADGSMPVAGLIQAADGDFYGTTSAGGSGNNNVCSPGCGTVFKITPAGKLTTLYAFCSQTNCPGGYLPDAGLIQGRDGDFYGTSSFGGNDCGCGVIFKITAKGKLTTLYNFNGNDGAYPGAALVQATDGNFYGTTSQGGSGGPCPYVYEGGCGTLFKITPAGKLTTLYNFCSGGDCATGYLPDGALAQATNGNFYGTTNSDPKFQLGTVFSLTVGLGPFVETRPTSGKVGAKVVILGTNLTGTTRVAVHGTEATFTVVSNSEITMTVPVGATTGRVEVRTPKNVLKSNVNFRVTP